MVRGAMIDAPFDMATRLFHEVWGRPAVDVECNHDGFCGTPEHNHHRDGVWANGDDNHEIHRAQQTKLIERKLSYGLSKRCCHLDGITCSGKGDRVREGLTAGDFVVSVDEGIPAL